MTPSSCTSGDEGQNAYRGINAIFDSNIGAWLCGDRTGTEIGRIDPNVTTHYGDSTTWMFQTPFVKLDGKSINDLEIETLSEFHPIDDASVALQATENGITYGPIRWMRYSRPSGTGVRFMTRRVGYVRNWVGFRFRGSSSTKMSFTHMRLYHD